MADENREKTGEEVAEKSRKQRGFAKGVSGNPAGRTKGSVNKSTAAMKELAESLLTDSIYREKLKERLRAGKAGQVEIELMHYWAGKPKDVVQLDAGSSLGELLALALSKRNGSGSQGTE